MNQMKKIMIMPIKVPDKPEPPKCSTITLECTVCHSKRTLTVPDGFKKGSPTTCPECGSKHLSIIAGYRTLRRR